MRTFNIVDNVSESSYKNIGGHGKHSTLGWFTMINKSVVIRPLRLTKGILFSYQRHRSRTRNLFSTFPERLCIRTDRRVLLCPASGSRHTMLTFIYVNIVVFLYDRGYWVSFVIFHCTKTGWSLWKSGKNIFSNVKLKLK